MSFTRPVCTEGPPTKKESAPGRYESLTVWRGLACLVVTTYHSLFTGYGRPVPAEGSFVFDALHKSWWLGIPLFFVISGYCVTASAESLARQNVPAWGFIWRRLWRIYPPYLFWLGILAVSLYLVEIFVSPNYFQAAMVPSPRGMTAWQWLGNLTLTETWRWHWTGGVETMLWQPGWTLCYEWQFYLLVGLALLFPRNFFFVALAVLTIAVGWATFVIEWNTHGTFLDGKWLLFAAGALVYYIATRVPSHRQGWFCAPLLLGILYAVADPKQLLRPEPNEPNQMYLMAFAFALALVFLKRWDGYISRNAYCRPLFFCGEMSYSVFLVHWPVVTVVGHTLDMLGVVHPAAILMITLPCCIGVTILLGRIFYVLVERRFRSARVRAR